MVKRHFGVGITYIRHGINTNSVLADLSCEFLLFLLIFIMNPLHIRFQAVTLGAVADKSMGGIWAVAAAFERAVGALVWRYPPYCYEGMRIITSWFFIFLVMH